MEENIPVPWIVWDIFGKTDILTYQEGYFCKFPQLTTIDKVFGHRVNYIIENIQIWKTQHF